MKIQSSATISGHSVYMRLPPQVRMHLEVCAGDALEIEDGKDKTGTFITVRKAKA